MPLAEAEGISFFITVSILSSQENCRAYGAAWQNPLHRRPGTLLYPAAYLKSLLLTFPRVALRVQIAPDKAEDDDFGYSKARTTTQYGPICAATLRAGANFPDLCVTRR